MLAIGIKLNIAQALEKPSLRKIRATGKAKAINTIVNGTI
jgi:hypothetical protein